MHVFVFEKGKAHENVGRNYSHVYTFCFYSHSTTLTLCVSKPYGKPVGVGVPKIFNPDVVIPCFPFRESLTKFLEMMFSLF